MSTDTDTESVEALAARLLSATGYTLLITASQAASMLRTLAAERDALRVALEAERERCAKLCEGMHPEDGPHAYAWVIRSTPKDPT